MPSVDLHVSNARIVTHERDMHASLLVRDGKVIEIVPAGRLVSAAVEIDAGGLLVLPGLVDPHVHFSEPGRTHWEGFATGTAAAVAGGITTVVEMPLNASPPTTTTERLEAKRDAARGKLHCDVALWGGVIANDLEGLPGLLAGGVAAIKVFLCEGSADYPPVDPRALRAVLTAAARHGVPVGVHAEDQATLDRAGASLHAQHRRDPLAWVEARPPEAETRAIEAALEAAAETGGALHVVHVSTGEGVELVHAARARGVDATVETCPHYLVFDQNDLAAIGALAKCAPPLRPPEQREALWAHLLEGRIDLVASDHSPCLIEEERATTISGAPGAASAACNPRFQHS